MSEHDFKAALGFLRARIYSLEADKHSPLVEAVEAALHSAIAQQEAREAAERGEAVVGVAYIAVSGGGATAANDSAEDAEDLLYEQKEQGEPVAVHRVKALLPIPRVSDAMVLSVEPVETDAS